MKQFNGKKKQKGLTMIELMLGLLVVLVIIGIAIIAFNNLRSSQRTQGMQSQLLQVLAGVQKIAPGPNYLGVSDATLIKAGHAPSDMVNDNGTALVNRFGGAVTVAPATYGGGTGAADNAVTITFNGVPRAECNAVIANTQPTFPRIAVGTTAVKDQFGATRVDYDQAATATACEHDANNIIFTYSGS